MAMKTWLSCAVKTMLLSGLFVNLLMAQTVGNPLGSAFSYQGQLKEAGQPATGLYDIQTCLFDGLVSATTLVCAPDLNDVPVADGLFTVALDFGAAAFFGQERYLELRVRPGASTGSYTVLNPRQLLRATPEALRANNAPWSGISGMPPGFADGVDNQGVSSITAGAGLSGGTITSSGTVAIANGGVTSAMIAAGGVGTSQLAANAVDASRILDESVNASDIASDAIGAAELASNAVDTAAIVDANVTSAKIAPGAIGSAQINPAQIQTRVTGSCLEGEYFRGINADGSLNCELLPVTFDRVLDDSGDAGKHIALAIRSDDRPIMAYHEDSAGSLRLYDCANPSCATGVRRTLDSAGDVGESIAMSIRPNGFPVITYRDVVLQSLKLYDCSNVNCSAGVARTLDDTVDVIGSISMALRADGRAVIAYVELTTFNLRIYDCANITCSSGVSRILSTIPTGTAIAIRADDRPIIALGGNAGQPLASRLLDCNDAGCTSNTIRTISNSGRSPIAMVLRSNGRPLLATTGSTYPLQVYDCADSVCTTNTLSVVDPDSSTDEISMVLRSDGLSLIAFARILSSTLSELRLFNCGTAGCSLGTKRIVIDTGRFDSYFSLALRSDGRPVLAFYDSVNEDLRLRICANPDCI
jgi:hypothetical protein